MAYSEVLWAANLLLLVVIFVRGIAVGLLARFTLFYTYIGFVLFTAISQAFIAAIFGLGSPSYYYGFHIPNLIVPFLQLLILWRIYRDIVGNNKTGHYVFTRRAILMALMVAPIGWTLYFATQELFARYHALALTVQMITCLLLYHQVHSHPEVILGRNVGGILCGISIMVAFQTFNFSRYIFEGARYEIFSFFLQFIYCLALIVFTYTLWEFQPLQRLKAEQKRSLERINEKLVRVLRSITSSR